MDLVYLWCDEADSHWRGRKEEAWAREGSRSYSTANQSSHFVDCGELRYSLRSAFANPLFAKIYLVTDGQRPTWLEPSARVQVVDHTQILSGPFFNSFAIESYVHRIPGLGEYFVLANDDFFFGEVSEEDFFFSDGKMKLRASPHLISPHRDAAGYAQACYRSAQALLNAFPSRQSWQGPVLPYYVLRHVAQVCSRSIAEEAEEVFAEPLRQSRQSAFRHAETIYPLFLWSYLALERRKARLCFEDDSLYATSDFNEEDLAQRLLSTRPKLFCLNAISTDHLEKWQAFLATMLPRLFPQPSPVEIVPDNVSHTS